MKAIVLTTGMALVYLVAITALFRCRAIERRARAMTIFFVYTVPLYVAAHQFTPADLWILPEIAVEPRPWVDLSFGILLWSAAFLGGILQLYNLADRGFSLRIVMDIQRSQGGSMSVDEIYTAYSGGRGIGWMYQKRLDDLVHHKLASIDDGHVRNLPSGQRLALAFGWLRRFLRMD